jgi:hypothetical protein
MNLPRRGPRATSAEQTSSFLMLRQGREDNGKWRLPEKGRARRKRTEARERVK